MFTRVGLSRKSDQNKTLNILLVFLCKSFSFKVEEFNSLIMQRAEQIYLTSTPQSFQHLTMHYLLSIHVSYRTIRVPSAFFVGTVSIFLVGSMLQIFFTQAEIVQH